jgi:hypothetical protein
MLFEGGALMVRRWPIPAALVALLLVAARAGGTQSLNLAIDEGETGGSDIKPGETLTLGLTIKHTRMSNPFSLPRTPGLVVNGSGSDPHSGNYYFFVTPSRAGDYVIPAFDIHTDSGQVLHVNALRLHVASH